MTIKEKIKTFQKTFNAYFEREIKNILKEQRDFQGQTTKYDAKLEEYILNYTHGGKRIRPFLISFFAEKDLADPVVLRACLASELFHLAALIHDDIIDESPMRRDAQTLHIAAGSFKENNSNIGMHIGLLLGDVFLTASLVHANAVSPEFFKHFSLMIQRTIRGQYLDVLHMNKDMGNITYEELMTRHDLKTAWYTFTSPASMGYLLHNAHSSKTLESIIPLTRSLGLLYQIRDDIIDCIDQNSGKNLYSDIFENQTTWVTLYVKKHYPKEFKEILNAKISNNRNDLKEIFNSIDLKTPYEIEFQKCADKIQDFEMPDVAIKNRIKEVLKLLTLK